MRRFRAPLAVLGVVVAAHGLLGQAPPLQAPNPYPAAVTLSNQTDVFSGPGATFYPTNRLRYGERVVVLGESKKAPGWFEILPPPGSFSWIDAKYVKTVAGVDKIGIVDTGDPKLAAPILPGSSLVNKEPNVEITRVASGTQLFLIDRPTVSGGVNYFPIVPVASEVRFVPMEAIRGGAYAGNSGYGNNPYGGQTIPTGGWQQSAGPATAPIGGWQANNPAAVQPNTFAQHAQQGDQALAAGNPERARLFYLEALGLTNDPAWRTYLTNQLARINPAGTGAAPNGLAANGQNPFQSASSPAAQQPLIPTGGPPAPPTAPAQKQWSQWGVLRSTTFPTRDNQPMYLLENRQNGAVLMYVTTNPGTSLRDYLGQTICVYGTVSYRNDDYIRMPLIAAEQVATPPAGAK